MVSYQKLKHVVGDKLLVEAVCLSTDMKPTENIADSSKLTEQDTGKKYLFNGGTWFNIANILGKEKGESGTEFIVEDGEATIVENGIQTFYPSDDVGGFGSFTVKTEVPTGGSSIIVDEKTFSSNGTYVAPEGHAYSPVIVAYEHPADLIARIQDTIKQDIPRFKDEYLEPMSHAVTEDFDKIITSQFARVLFYLTGE